ncbi:hypothetical protein O181_031807 [Austropuccinia psidii MF-1]|uniref:Uncharacterized protein n=1 Tax=Austropuccinia psidii MF-1 TaxID=1389203 RepID=A0A9Q3D1E6_9BASI|nr:hypothetical protein [Austropuccinia psidii MF-1]
MPHQQYCPEIFWEKGTLQIVTNPFLTGSLSVVCHVQQICPGTLALVGSERPVWAAITAQVFPATLDGRGQDKVVVVLGWQTPWCVDSQLASAPDVHSESMTPQICQQDIQGDDTHRLVGQPIWKRMESVGREGGSSMQYTNGEGRWPESEFMITCPTNIDNGFSLPFTSIAAVTSWSNATWPTFGGAWHAACANKPSSSSASTPSFLNMVNALRRVKIMVVLD